MRVWAIALLVTSIACGDRVVYRPLIVDVQNVSATADVLVLKVLAGDDVEQTCGTINLANVQNLSTPYEARWLRESGTERQLDLPEIDSDRAVVVVYTEDERGVAIQLACGEIEYKEIESGRITLRLSTKMARIILPWRMCLARSSSIGCSGEVEWRKYSSPIATIMINKRSWSSNASGRSSQKTRST
jgi:hypothetical protein